MSLRQEPIGIFTSRIRIAILIFPSMNMIVILSIVSAVQHLNAVDLLILLRTGMKIDMDGGCAEK